MKVSRGPELPTERVERELREYVKTLKSGAQLPASAALASQLGTSKATLRRVINKLATEGLLIVRHGWGTFVA